MDMIPDLNGAIDRCTKYAIRALKRNDDPSAYNALNALVHMHIRVGNYQKVVEIMRVAREVFKEL